MNFVINLEFIREIIRIRDTAARRIISGNEVSEVKLKA